MNSLRSLSFPSPIGRIEVYGDDAAITGLRWVSRETSASSPDPADPLPHLAEARAQIEAYFDGSLRTFDLPLRLAGGTDFELAVWHAMQEIPYGMVWTYGELATHVGGVARAVGGACGRNPIPIIVPCHRVIGSDGKLVGFSGTGGIRTKRFLLALESPQGSLF